MALRKINHLDIYVDNLEKVQEHFEKLGFKPVGKPVHGAKSIELILPDSEITFEFHQLTEKYKKSEEASWGRAHIDHIAFEVDDIGKEYEELKSKGVSFKTVPSLDSSGRKLCRTCDADERYWIQLVEVKSV